MIRCCRLLERLETTTENVDLSTKLGAAEVGGVVVEATFDRRDRVPELRSCGREIVLPGGGDRCSLDEAQAFLESGDRRFTGRQWHGRGCAVLPRLRIDDRSRGAKLLQRRPLLCERACEIEARQASLLDQDLADAGAGFALGVECSLELVVADEAKLDKDLTNRPSDGRLNGRFLDKRERHDRCLLIARHRGLELCPLLSEDARELEPRDAELCHDDLTQALTGVLLQFKGPLELIIRNQALCHEDGADQA